MDWTGLSSTISALALLVGACGGILKIIYRQRDEDDETDDDRAERLEREAERAKRIAEEKAERARRAREEHNRHKHRADHVKLLLHGKLAI